MKYFICNKKKEAKKSELGLNSNSHPFVLQIPRHNTWLSCNAIVN